MRGARMPRPCRSNFILARRGASLLPTSRITLKVRACRLWCWQEARLAAARKAFDGARWDEAARLAEGPSDQSSQLDLLLGLALSRMERWGQAKTAFQVGAKKSPRDARFPVELAGIAYKQKDF